ncbi:MAG: phage virion morphogenesis protein [Candidatus Glassbacteria bacterium]|nr:phage virion morphogenesis protein [Candidatus Glassbacteria bacterium]
MAESGVRLTGDWPEFRRAVRNLANFPFAKFHAFAGETIINQTQARFDSERGPDGKPWPESARVKRFGGKVLTDTARLRNSLSKRADGDKVIVGTNVVYAAIHQAGGEIKAKRKPRLVFNIPGVGIRTAKKVKIPARPYMGFSPEDRRELAEELRGLVKELTKK